ncbi:MAG TPA: HD domain-containing protein [Elusimicrobiales bacterium]|nr:HD domain-containing protein [Elusimicrobiales bacterium]HOL62431.1 HD domain-containing protein [Elusimicrobiales bacterium]HPO94377.1 HD domain-containing protein [Elusimicrobiales bacterium]
MSLKVIKILSQYDSYIVGGAVRNYLIEKEIKDLDIVIETNEKDFLKIIKNLSKTQNIFPLDKERGIYRINVLGDLTIDISTIKDIESDIIRRDFTVNALAIDIKKVKINIKKDSFNLKIKQKDIIDIVQGVKDIKGKRIKALSEKSIEEDPLRMLRAYRFFSVLDFKIDKETEEFIKKHKNLISQSSPERIREEIVKILETDKSAKVLSKMADTEILFEIFPELKLQIKCAEIYYGKGGVLKHTFNVIKRLDILFPDISKYLNLQSKLIEEVKKQKALIKMAALLHDIAKPHKAKYIKDRLRFFGHEEYGGVLAEKTLKNLRYSNNEIRYIKTVISNHLRIGNIAHNNIITKKAILRIFYDLKEFTLGLLILSWADHSSYISEKTLKINHNKTKEKPFEIKTKLPKAGYKKTLRFLQVVNMICKNYSKYRFVYDLKPLLNGNDIMKILAIPPSPKVGDIIRKLINLQIEEKIKNKQEAVNYVKSLKNQ